MQIEQHATKLLRFGYLQSHRPEQLFVEMPPVTSPLVVRGERGVDTEISVLGLAVPWLARRLEQKSDRKRMQ